MLLSSVHNFDKKTRGQNIKDFSNIQFSPDDIELEKNQKWLDIKDIPNDFFYQSSMEKMTKESFAEKLMVRTKKYFILGLFSDEGVLTHIVAGRESNKRFFTTVNKMIYLVYCSPDSSALFSKFQKILILKEKYFSLDGLKSVDDNFKNGKKISYYIGPVTSVTIGEKKLLRIKKFMRKHCSEKIQKIDLDQITVTDKTRLIVDPVSEKTFEEVYEMYKREGEKYSVFEEFTKKEFHDQLLKNKFLQTFVFYSPLDEEKKNIIGFVTCQNILNDIPIKLFQWYSTKNSYTLFNLLSQATIEMLAKEKTIFIAFSDNMNYNDTWQLFGTGVHEINKNFRELFVNINTGKLTSKQCCVRLV